MARTSLPLGRTLDELSSVMPHLGRVAAAKVAAEASEKRLTEEVLDSCVASVTVRKLTAASNAAHRISFVT